MDSAPEQHRTLSLLTRSALLPLETTSATRGLRLMAPRLWFSKRVWQEPQPQQNCMWLRLVQAAAQLPLLSFLQSRLSSATQQALAPVLPACLVLQVSGIWPSGTHLATYTRATTTDAFTRSPTLSQPQPLHTASARVGPQSPMLTLTKMSLASPLGRITST